MEKWVVVYIFIAIMIMLAGIVLTFRAAVRHNESSADDDSWEGMTTAGIVCSIILGLFWMFIPVLLLLEGMDE